MTVVYNKLPQNRIAQENHGWGATTMGVMEFAPGIGSKKIGVGLEFGLGVRGVHRDMFTLVLGV